MSTEISINIFCTVRLKKNSKNVDVHKNVLYRKTTNFDARENI